MSTRQIGLAKSAPSGILVPGLGRAIMVKRSLLVVLLLVALVRLGHPPQAIPLGPLGGGPPGEGFPANQR